MSSTTLSTTDSLTEPQVGIYPNPAKDFVTISNLKKGQEIGYITDEFGNEVQKINAAAEGIILYKIGTPPVNKGETLFCIGSR